MRSIHPYYFFSLESDVVQKMFVRRLDDIYKTSAYFPPPKS